MSKELYNLLKPTKLDTVSDYRWEKPRQFFCMLIIGICCAVVGLFWLMNV